MWYSTVQMTDQEWEEDWDEDPNQDFMELMNLLREDYLQRIRSDLFNRIYRVQGGQVQWRFIIGKLSRYPNGELIQLSENSLKALQRWVDYMNSEEGLDELRELGIEPPDHIDSLIDLVQSAKTDRQMKADSFRLFLKHRSRILEYLTRYHGY